VSDHEPDERPELAAFHELHRLITHLGEELAGFRVRALQAEARLRALEQASQTGDLFDASRVPQLERENRELRERLEVAAGRARDMLQRVHFLRQQHELAGGGGGAR
jgi:hypothetical protein